MVDGKAVVSDSTTVYRMPAEAPQDIQNFKAMMPPPGMDLPFNGVMFSSHDRGLADMASGDYDGDLRPGPPTNTVHRTRTRVQTRN